MTERGLPLADGAPACPFVAFDDDRDERSSVPDHRHRCFAEAHPAPRALAHQEAYCLSSAFPVCPTFQDWARREAAHSRDAGRAVMPPAAASTEDRGRAAPPVVAPDLAAAASAARPDEAAEAIDERDEREEGDPRAGAAAALGGAATGLGGTATGAGSGGDPDLGSDDARDDDLVRPASPPDGYAQRNPPRDWAAPPPWLASTDGRRAVDADAEPPSFLGRRSEPGQGLAGSAADRMAGGFSPPPPAARSRDEEEWTSAARLSGESRSSRAADRDDHGYDDHGEDELVEDEPRRSSRRPRAYNQHLGGTDGPDWERPRRYEAYPTIRTRVGLPGVRVPQVAVMAGLLVVLALALFFLPGMINLGGSGGPAGSAAPSSSARPSVSVAPTEPPAPTPVLYTIKKGDTLSKIAAAHGITVDELLAANPAIKDPNKIGLGQQIVIPSPSEEPPDTVGESTAP
ncbi:MAG TPA: LysM domain-containing protein [Candidatus Limnocylindrales bacterium]|nr:LysM domain-containing protein [Candidatus Limnocylindrales bacterium]